MESKEYNVRIKLISNQNSCHVGHRIGDEWLFDYTTPAGMCSLAFNAIYPMLIAFKYGATFPWQEEPDKIIASCPDSDVNNVFELKRIPK
jgi:uncharacterized repeat protein (TIGR04076 family)